MQILKNGHLLIARFGLMHMTATNLCVWLNLIVQETKHEIMHFSEHQRGEHHGEGAVHDSENLASGIDLFCVVQLSTTYLSLDLIDYCNYEKEAMGIT